MKVEEKLQSHRQGKESYAGTVTEHASCNESRRERRRYTTIREDNVRTGTLWYMYVRQTQHTGGRGNEDGSPPRYLS